MEMCTGNNFVFDFVDFRKNFPTEVLHIVTLFQLRFGFLKG